MVADVEQGEQRIYIMINYFYAKIFMGFLIFLSNTKGSTMKSNLELSMTNMYAACRLQPC